MKKLVFCILCSVFLLTGCGNVNDTEDTTNNNDTSTSQEENVKTMTCTRTTNQSNFSADFNYEVNYKGSYVTFVRSTEKITSDDESVLEQYKTAVENIYSPYKDIEYYDYDVTIDGNTLTSLAEINYEKIDTDKMIEVDSANAQIIKDGKVKLSDIKQVYESVGAICE